MLKLLLRQILEDHPEGNIGLLQSLLLLNTFGRMFCTAAQHTASQLFHSPTIVLANFLGVLEPSEPVDEDSGTLASWFAWAEQEERIRVGWLAFVLDCSNAALYR